MSKLVIRVAKTVDAEALLDIYRPYVEDTAITFEYTVPSVEEFTERIRRTLEKYPYLVAESGGRILGYAYAGAFQPRAAYGWAVETSVYVHPDCRKQGVGNALYEALEEVLMLQNILNVNACIATPLQEDEHLTWDSVRFHEKMGYRMVGEFYQCGYKFDRWYNMAWMEKHLKEHEKNPLPVLAFRDIKEQCEKLF